MFNTVKTMEALQQKIDETLALEDWFKDFSSEVTNHLSKIFKKSEVDFNPYNMYEVNNDNMTYFIEVAETLRVIQQNYLL